MSLKQAVMLHRLKLKYYQRIFFEKNEYDTLKSKNIFSVPSTISIFKLSLIAAILIGFAISITHQNPSLTLVFE